MTEKRQILKSAWIIGLFTLASRICGYWRDQRITLLLGTSGLADSFILAFRIPNLIRHFIGEGSMTAAFVPVFTEYLNKRSEEETWEFAQRVFWTAALVLSVIAVLGSVFSGAIIHVFTIFGRSSTQWNQAVFLNRVMFPYALLIGLAAVAMSILNSLLIFGLPAATSVLFNLSVILFSCGAIYRPVMKWAPVGYRTPAASLAAGILLGGTLQFVVQVPELVKRGMRFRFSVSFTDPGVRRVAALLGPSLVGIGIYQVNAVVDTIFATSGRMPEGSVTALYVADRIMELVLGTYAIVVATAILPVMSRQAAMRDFPKLKQTLAFSVRIVSFITIPAALGLMVLRRPIVSVLFEHGHFGPESTALTARALLYYAAGLPAIAGVKLVMPAFYSQQDTKTPVAAAAGAMVVNVALNVLFLVFLFGKLQNGTPALATSLAAYFNFFLLFFILRGRVGALGGRAVAYSLGKVAVSSAAMAGACVAMLRLTAAVWGGPIIHKVAALTATVSAAVGIFIGVSWLLGCEEIHELVDILKQRPEAGTGMALPG